MPIYRFQCPTCQSRHDLFKRIAERNEVEYCPHCNFTMNRVLTAPAVRGDYEGYACPVTGKWIEGRRAHEENLKRQGCRLYEPGETEALKRSRAADEAALDRSIDSTVEQFIETLPTRKREQLAAEIEGGLDVAITRN